MHSSNSETPPMNVASDQFIRNLMLYQPEEREHTLVQLHLYNFPRK